MLRPPTPVRPDSPPAFTALDPTDTPFGDDSIAAVPSMTPPRLLGALSQPLPSLDRILRPDVDIELNRRDPKGPPIRLKRKSTMLKTHNPRKQPLVRRNTTWSGGVRQVSLEGALSSPLDAREVWADHSRTLTSSLIPGSLAFHQNLPLFTSREGPGRKVGRDLRTHPVPESPVRAKSQPMPADIENCLLPNEVPMRRSASLHSIHSSSTPSVNRGVPPQTALRNGVAA
jgi:hypothetical protein